MSGAPTTRDLLSRCTAPRELRRLERGQLDQLAAQIRAFLIDNVSRTGGHLGPNLGVVELTIGLHRVFRSPQDTIVFDTGHQSYVHKLLTGRQDFSSLRSPGGLSGYPSRAESEHDVVESSHASSSLAWVDGISREKHRRGERTWTVGVIGAFSSLLLLLPKLLIPSACVWLFGGALMLFLPPGAFRKSRMAMYWAVICFAAVVALLIMLLQRYQAYGDLYEGLSYDILRVMMNARTRPQVLYSAYVSGLAALDAKRTAALESLAALTGGNVLPWLSEDVLQQLEWSLRATIERTLPSIMPDLLVKGIMAFSLGMLLCWRKFPDAEDTPTTDRWFMPTPLGISMAVLLLLSAAQLFTTNATVALAASLLGSVAFWSFAVQGVSAQNFAMIRAGATRGRRWFLTILMVLFVPILPMFAGCVDQIRDPRGLRDDRHRKDDDFSDF